MEQGVGKLRVRPQREVKIRCDSVFRIVQRVGKGHAGFFQSQREFRVAGKTLESCTESLSRQLAVVVLKGEAANGEVGGRSLGICFFRRFEVLLEDVFGVRHSGSLQELAVGHGLAGLPLCRRLRAHLQRLFHYDL